MDIYARSAKAFLVTKAMTEKEYKRKKRKEFLQKAAVVMAAALVIIAIGIWNFYLPLRTLLPVYAIAARGDGEMRIHFLDVGQGDAEIAELPDGSVYVIDAGDGSWEHGNHLITYLRSIGAEKLDLIMTHADADHAGGFSLLFDAFEVETLYLPILPAATGIYREAIAAAEKYGCEQRSLVRYDVLTGGDAYAVCISPHAANEIDGNDSSIVLYLSYAGVNFLLGGDISYQREEDLLEEYALAEEIGEDIFDSGEYQVRLEDTDVLKVSHHGSAYSSTKEWIELLSPKTAVISCGAGNLYGHPSEEAISTLSGIRADIYRIDELGDIMITVAPDGTYKTEYGYLK